MRVGRSRSQRKTLSSGRSSRVIATNLPVGKITVPRRFVNPGDTHVMPKAASAAAPHWKAFADRRRDPETKREAVLQTAAQLFLEKSYGRTSMNDVAERLNITKPALYHYFHNKEEVLLECYRMGTAMNTPKPVIAMLIRKHTASSFKAIKSDKPTPMNGATAIRITA